MGLYRSRGDLLHAVRGRGLPPHHLLPRPPGRDGRLHHADRGRQGRGAGPALQRQPRRVRATCPAERATSRSGTIRSPSPPTCSRWSPASSACVADSFTTMSGRDVALRSTSSPARRTRCAYAMDALKRVDALGRAGLRPRIRPRPLHDRRRRRLQHGRDGEQGPQRLQLQVRARIPETATDADYAASRRSSPTNTSTTGPATASPAATGSSSA